MIFSNNNIDVCEQYKDYQVSKLTDIQEYINNVHDCRHQLICINFGEKLKKSCLNMCDNCLHNKENIYFFDFSKIAKKLIKIITRFTTRIDKDSLIKKILIHPYF